MIKIIYQNLIYATNFIYIYFLHKIIYALHRNIYAFVFVYVRVCVCEFSIYYVVCLFVDTI